MSNIKPLAKLPKLLCKAKAKTKLTPPSKASKGPRLIPKLVNPIRKPTTITPRSVVITMKSRNKLETPPTRLSVVLTSFFKIRAARIDTLIIRINLTILSPKRIPPSSDCSQLTSRTINPSVSVTFISIPLTTSIYLR